MDNYKIDSAGEDPQVVAIIEEMLNKIRSIVDRFEDIVHDIWNLFQLAKEMFKHFRMLFNPEGGDYALQEVQS